MHATSKERKEALYDKLKPVTVIPEQATNISERSICSHLYYAGMLSSIEWI